MSRRITYLICAGVDQIFCIGDLKPMAASGSENDRSIDADEIVQGRHIFCRTFIEKCLWLGRLGGWVRHADRLWIGIKELLYQPPVETAVN